MSRPLSRPDRALVVVGVSCVIIGGLVAAVTGPLGLDEGSWSAAYLVLVGGVAQVAIGLAPSRLAARAASPALGWSTLASWNLGNASIIAGTLIGLPLLVDAGAVLLVIGLGAALSAVRYGAAAPRPGASLRLGGGVYRCLLLVLLVSIPIGVLLAHVRVGS